MVKRRVQVSDKNYTYISLLRIYYYPEKTFDEVLTGIIDCFESTYGLKTKLLEE
jgi:hypothetical protein